jgi:hypothetical protein
MPRFVGVFGDGSVESVVVEGVPCPIRARVASRTSRTGEKQCPIERPADYLLFINPQLVRFQPVDHL